MRKYNTIFLIAVIMVITGCMGDKTESIKIQPEQKADKSKSAIILSTTTSTRDSGLLDYLLPEFTKETGVEVKVVAVGTGKALQMGRDGEADVLLVHAKESELKFIEEGHGFSRYDVMYNDFVLLGPQDDPLGLFEVCPEDITEGFRIINEKKHKFISRGDESGTHKKEKSIWGETGTEPQGDHYISAGKGMGDVIKIADEMQAYTLSDRATFLNFRTDLDLKIVIEGDEGLFNQYGVIAVDPGKNTNINKEGAEKFVEWILSQKTQEMIGQYGIETFGAPLFVPNAKVR